MVAGKCKKCSVEFRQYDDGTWEHCVCKKGTWKCVPWSPPT